MNNSKILSRLRKLEGCGIFNQEETLSLEEKLTRAKEIFTKYYNSTESEQREFLEGIYDYGGAVTHEDMISSYKSFGIGD